MRTSFGKKGLPSPRKIATRGLYELMWGAPTRDYGERVGQKKKKKKEDGYYSWN